MTLLFVSFCGFWPLLILLFWDMITASESPYVVLAALLLGLAILMCLLTLELDFVGSVQPT